MAVAQPYVPGIRVPIPSGRKATLAVKDYFRGTSAPSWLAFGALAAMFLVAIFAPLLAPFDPLVPAGKAMAAPSAENWLGTDTVGRDVLSRVLVGMSTSWWGALAVVASGVLIGGLIGLIAGAVGGVVDAALMRITDVFLSLPGPILAIAVVAAMGPSYIHTLIGVAIVWWPLYARIVRAEIRKLRASPHMEAARIAGAGRRRQLTRHLLPGAVPVTIVTASLDISALVLLLAGLSFLGLGAPQPAPELGAMSAQGLTHIFSAWWIPIFPAVAVGLIAIVSNFAGDALRDRIRDR
ncbi:putative D,D-dipeptide transport system permease protein DdpC [Mycolicibacterium vanbaalenii]|uniref:Putative D,D-dipeptide transport system permease protein DdpC n=1 Tax=Mycolicibacterium vanbaalenii TaxID=110539 RepID=A0A5S9R8E4_MYCVN|nr:ABC transporter permease [Mycolicibacterium vanbaalenii]CAA0133222.1 putative D,D-dipeptide transport system permease protein DdpC [Mycolicibacterium vanbaalenii]